MHLNLVDALDLVFHRVLDGDDLAARIVEDAEHGGERGGLAAAGGTRDHDHAMRVLDLLAHHRKVSRREAEPVDVRRLGVGAQEADGDAFAVDGRHGRHADVVFALGDAQPGAAILRQALLGDVEVGENLETRDRGAAQFAGQPLTLLQQAIDAMANDHVAARRFDVEVGGACGGGLTEQAVDEIDDRCVEGQVLQRIVIISAGGAARLFSRAAFIEALDGGKNLVVGSERQRQFEPGGEPEGGERCRVGRIADDDQQPVALDRDRQHMALAHEAQRDRVRQHTCGWPAGGNRQIEHPAQLGGKHLLVDQALAQQQPDFRLAAGRRLANDVGRLLIRDEGPLREIAEKVFHGCLSYRASLNRTINGGRSGDACSCRLQGAGRRPQVVRRLTDDCRDVLQLAGKRAGSPPDHADGAAGLRTGKAGKRNVGRAGFDRGGHFRDEGDPDPRTDHLDQRRQGTALQHLARQGRGHVTEGQGLVAEAVTLLQQEQAHFLQHLDVGHRLPGIFSGPDQEKFFSK